jgi:hypothetical protein
MGRGASQRSAMVGGSHTGGVGTCGSIECALKSVVGLGARVGSRADADVALSTRRRQSRCGHATGVVASDQWRCNAARRRKPKWSSKGTTAVLLSGMG